MDVRAALARLAEGRDLDQQEAREVFTLVMSGEATPAQIGALLMGFRVKGETAAEIAGAVETMRALSTRVEVDVPNLVDTCGTGGSGAKLFNVSTAAAFVAAAAGAHVAKHGNRKASSASGSADLLEAAGVRITLTPPQIARCIREVGVGFLFAPAHHNAMKHAAPVRQEVGVRTMMNLLGPLTNPAGARRQLIGVFSREFQRTIAEVLSLLDAEHVLVVHSNGLDEIALDGGTRVVELKDGVIEEYEIAPEDFGLERRSRDGLRADSPAASLALVRQSLTEPASPAADLVSLNAGAAIYVAGIAGSLSSGVALAREAIVTGSAMQRFDELIRLTNSLEAP
ncbi:MAG TPA: anthranilate phosphoribosyltransferase [Pseudomonadales bacterium]